MVELKYGVIIRTDDVHALPPQFPLFAVLSRYTPLGLGALERVAYASSIRSTGSYRR